MVSQVGVVKVPAVYMREGPSDTERVNSQAICGEEVKILETGELYYKVQTSDEYVGWVTQDSIAQKIEKSDSGIDLIAKVTSLRALLFTVKDTEWGEVLAVPFGSRFTVIEQYENPRWLRVRTPDSRALFIQSGDVTFAQKKLTKDKVVDFCKRFLGVPFAWGGRSSFGLDSSGFSQLVCREMGVSVPRDSKDQIVSDKFETIEWSQLEPGDFIFHGLAQDKIRHVGIYMGNDEMINSTVRNLRTGVSVNSLKDSPWNGDELPYRVARRLKVE